MVVIKTAGVTGKLGLLQRNMVGATGRQGIEPIVMLSLEDLKRRNLMLSSQKGREHGKSSSLAGFQTPIGKKFRDEKLNRIRDKVLRGEAKEAKIDEEGVLRIKGRVCVPRVDYLIHTILTDAHSTRYSIHPGAAKMYRDLKQHFWWSRMKRDIVDFVAQFPNCQNDITTRRAIGKKVEKGVANAGAPPQANQVPPQDNQVPPQVQDVVIPRHMMDGYIRYVFFTLSQDMTTQAQEVASPDQAMMDQANQEMVRTRATTVPTPTSARQEASEPATGVVARRGVVERGCGIGHGRTSSRGRGQASSPSGTRAVTPPPIEEVVREGEEGENEKERIRRFMKGLRSELRISALQRSMLESRECYGCGEIGHIKRYCPKQSYRPPIVRGRGGHERGRYAEKRGGRGNGGHQTNRGCGQTRTTAVQHGRGNEQTDAVSFLGHVVSKDGVMVDPSKIKTVKNWNVPFVWSDECEESFQKLKTLLTAATILTLPVEVLLHENLSYKEEHVAILDREVRKLSSREMASIKVQWKNRPVEEATWEKEVDMQERYPHLFTDSGTPFRPCFSCNDRSRSNDG
ncbi:uncharacterized protein [Solanum lycopersicum]|uniref:uncharacterized protein n=1 Tax=Solanum lycopersicum TaxID=4081 RepID=UPI003748D166